MRNYITILLAFTLFSACQDSKKSNPNDFIFLENGNYIIDSYNGIFVYRLEETGEIMDGYYVVSNAYGKAEEFNVTKGILNGINITFHNNNEVYSQSHYKQGKKHGEELTYYQSGKLQKKTTYNNGILVGSQISYFESGQIQTESKIEHEEIIESTSYDIIGNIVSQMYLKDSRTITQTISNGKITREHINSNYDDFDAMKFYDNEGELQSFLRLYVDGDTRYLIELDENENEIRRINMNDEPQNVLKYRQYLSRL